MPEILSRRSGKPSYGMVSFQDISDSTLAATGSTHGIRPSRTILIRSQISMKASSSIDRTSRTFAANTTGRPGHPQNAPYRPIDKESFPKVSAYVPASSIKTGDRHTLSKGQKKQ